MIEVVHIPQTRRFVARLRFSGQTRPERLEIDHHPEMDPPRRWTFHSQAAGNMPSHCEVRLFGPEGGFTIDLVCQPGPIVIMVNKFGLTIMGQS